MSSITQQQIQDVLEKTCSGIDVIDGLFGGKTDKVRVVSQFCGMYGDYQKSKEIVLSSRKIDERTTEILVESAGEIVETITYEGTMLPVKRLTFALTTAVLADSWDSPMGWFAATTTGGVTYYNGHVAATTVAEYNGQKAKEAMRAFINQYNNDVTSIEVDIPSTESNFIDNEDALQGYEDLPKTEFVFQDNATMTFAQKNITLKNSRLLEDGNEVGIGAILKSAFEVLTVNNQTYDITTADDLAVRNAIDSIPKVSFLLSNILIKSGEVLDVGSAGVYEVQGGDTLSEIAQSHSMSTQDLLKLNTWLVDEGRVEFEQDKVLIDSSATNLDNKDHTLEGTAA